MFISFLRDEMEVVREKSLSPEVRQENPDMRGERSRGWEAGGNLERLGVRQLSESSADLPKRFIITKDQKSVEVGNSPSLYCKNKPQHHHHQIVIITITITPLVDTFSFPGAEPSEKL